MLDNTTCDRNLWFCQTKVSRFYFLRIWVSSNFKCVALVCVSVMIFDGTVDGRNSANQLRLVVYPIIYKVLYIPGGAGFLRSTVVLTCRRCSVRCHPFHKKPILEHWWINCASIEIIGGYVRHVFELTEKNSRFVFSGDFCLGFLCEKNNPIPACTLGVLEDG